MAAPGRHEDPGGAARAAGAAPAAEAAGAGEEATLSCGSGRGAAWGPPEF